MADPNLMPEGAPDRFEVVMGFDMVEQRPDYCRYHVKLGPQHRNRQGAPHGGVLSALIDAAGLYAGCMDPETGQLVRAVTISMTCNYVGAAEGDLLVCEGRMLKRGRGTFFAEARLTDGPDGPLLATGQGAYKFLR